MLFEKDYVYLVFQTAIQVTFCMGSPLTNYIHPFPSGDYVHSLFKFQLNWIAGFGGKSATNSPFVNLYKITGPAPILSFQKQYQLSNNSGGISANFWNPQSFIINSNSNTIAFHMWNYNAVAPPMQSGMYYLFANTFPCMGPLPLMPPCPPGPSTPPALPFGPVYKHYNAPTYLTGPA